MEAGKLEEFEKVAAMLDDDEVEAVPVGVSPAL